MRMRPNASFAMLSLGFALLGSGCPATYITVSNEGGAGGTGVGGASVVGGASGFGEGGYGYGGVGGNPDGPYGGTGGWSDDCNCYGGAGGEVAGAGGFGEQPCVGGAGGFGGEGGYGGVGGIGGYGGIGIGGAGGDPCNEPEYYGCLNRYDAQNGGVGGAPSVLCEQFAPWSDEHERCVNYYLNGGVGSFEEGGAGGSSGEPVDAGSPE